MKTAFRKLIGLLAPRGTLDIAVKTVLFSIVIAGWHVASRRFLFGDRTTPSTELMFEAAFTAAPFILLFLVGCWHQVAAIRALTGRAFYDPLAQTLNRQTFMNRFKRTLARTQSGLLLVIDADHFKRINDEYGHAVGDRCIEAIGHRLRWNIRDRDLAGRIGGEEFAVFLPMLNEIHGLSVAQRIGAPVSFTDSAGKTHLTVTLSIGGTFIDKSKNVEEHLKDADEALYRAKAAGRARICIHEKEEAIRLSPSVDLAA